MTAVAIIFLILYVCSFAIAFIWGGDGEWQTGTILWHFLAGLAVGVLIF